MHQTHSKFWCIQLSGIFRYIQVYSALSRGIKIYWGIINEYSSLFRYIQHPVEPSHIHNLAIFQALAHLESEAYSKPCETFIKHIQNPAIVRIVHSGIIQSYRGIFKILCNPRICRNLAYLESWNNQNFDVFKTRQIFCLAFLLF